MKIRLLFLLSFVFAFGFFKEAKAQALNAQQAENVMWDYLRKYSPDSYQMMQNLEDRPTSFQLGNTRIKLPSETPPMTWVNDLTDEGVRTSLNTIVHETIHGFTSSWPYVMLQNQNEIQYKFRDNFSAFFISQDEIHLVKHTKVFSSHEISRYIPKELKTFRFNPYIIPKDNDLGSQVQGIYGLMDEWNAYYHGTKMAYELFEHYQHLAKDDPQIYLEHISDLAGTYFAHYEFKYYILRYMMLARKKYPEIYGDILSNYELRRAYKAIDDHFTALIEDFQLRLDNLADTLGSESGSPKASERNGFFFIGRKGVGLFIEERDNLKKELTKPEFMEMHKILKPVN